MSLTSAVLNEHEHTHRQVCIVESSAFLLLIPGGCQSHANVMHGRYFNQSGLRLDSCATTVIMRFEKFRETFKS